MTDLFATAAQFIAQVDISSLPKVNADSDRLQVIFNLILSIMGTVGVLIVVLAGIRYMTSRGNPQETAKAKNAILFTIIGLVVIMLAFVIVNFVVTRIA